MRGFLWLNSPMPIKETLRRLVYQTEKMTQRARFASLPTPENGWPVLLGISFPKSGTHLLDQILLGFSRVAPFSRRLHSFYAEYEGESGRKRAPEQALRWLDSCARAILHLHTCLPVLKLWNALCSARFRALLHLP